MTRTIERVLIAAAVILLIVGVLWLRSCQSTSTAKTETKLATGQAGAATESGHDAVQTIGNSQANVTAEAQIVEETRHAINNATDARGASAAGRGGLCRLASYRGKPECLQHAAPR